MAFRASALNSWSKLCPPPMGESRPEGSMQAEKAISVCHSAAARGLIPGHVSYKGFGTDRIERTNAGSCWLMVLDYSLCVVLGSGST